MGRIIRVFIEVLVRAWVESLRRSAARRALVNLDGCEWCGEDAEYFVDVTPKSRHMTVRLACTPCGGEAVLAGAQILMGSDGKPVGR